MVDFLAYKDRKAQLLTKNKTKSLVFKSLNKDKLQQVVDEKLSEINYYNKFMHGEKAELREIGNLIDSINLREDMSLNENTVTSTYSN